MGGTFHTRMQDDAKRQVGQAVARFVEDGMTLGLGTGSTAAHALHALSARISAEGLRVRGVPTSFATERLARELGVPLVTLDEAPELDLAFDGADEVDDALRLVKGRGAAHTREKVVASVARRFVVLVDADKRVERLGTRAPVPVEVLPMAMSVVERRLRRLGARPVLRMGKAKDGPVVTDQGFWILDAHFDGGVDDPEALAAALDAQPGVLDHGLFLGLATDVLVGQPDGTVLRLTPPVR